MVFAQAGSSKQEDTEAKTQLLKSKDLDCQNIMTLFSACYLLSQQFILAFGGTGLVPPNSEQAHLPMSAE